MINYERLLLTITQEDLRLIRQLIVNAKTTLAPITLSTASGPVENHGSLNFKYLDVIILDRATLASEIFLRALPETLYNYWVTIYLSYREFQTVQKLLEEAVFLRDAAAEQYQELWAQLDVANLNFDSRYRNQPYLDSAD